MDAIIEWYMGLHFILKIIVGLIALFILYLIIWTYKIYEHMKGGI